MGLHGYRHDLVSMVTSPSPSQELDINIYLKFWRIVFFPSLHRYLGFKGLGWKFHDVLGRKGKIVIIFLSNMLMTVLSIIEWERDFDEEILWQWNETPILWVWVFCWIRGEGKMGWGNNMLLFGYGSQGQEWDVVQMWYGIFLCWSPFEVIIHIYHSGAVDSLH